MFDKIPTGANLMKRSFHGPFWCHLCRLDEENTEHLFLSYPSSREFWNSISAHYTSLNSWQGNNIQEAWKAWCHDHRGKARNLPLLVYWAIWIARNHSIFNLKDPHWPTILHHTIADYDLLPEDDNSAPPRTIIPESIDYTKPWAYFDGSAQEAGCGGGSILHLNASHKFKIHINLGRGTNNFAELCTAKHLIYFALEHHCRHLQLFGDSKIVCDWLNNTSYCNAYTLSHILGEAQRLISSFDSFVCRHIYREQNSEADQLSKVAAHLQDDD